jgi:hypothetical protein
MPAVGEEQVVDIELDKATVLMPIRTDYTPIDAKVLWNLDSGPQEPTGRIDGDISKDREAGLTEGEHILRCLYMKLCSFAIIRVWEDPDQSFRELPYDT